MPRRDATARSVAVAGCGHWGPNHVRAFARLPGVRVSWVVDTDPSRLRHVVAHTPGLRATTDYEAVLRDPQVDAIVVATPARSHAQLALAALAAGKHVLCEKPLGLTSAECQSLIDTAASRQLVVMAGHVFLFNPGILAIKSLIDDQSLGRIRYATAERTNPGPVRTDVDVAWDLAAHEIAIFNFLFDALPVSVSASGQRTGVSNGADVAFLRLTYPNTISVAVTVSWLHPRKVRQLSVVGDDGMASFDDLAAQKVSVSPVANHAHTEPYYDTYGEFHLLSSRVETIQPALPAAEPLLEQASHFMRALDIGHAGRADAARGLDVVRTLEAVTESMRRDGSPVDLPQPAHSASAA